ncbi:uncharacterized protein LOC107303807 [Oryza brachyantha]|uniref:uncharacterized protein LOC107303807 n=1 Tax=Oryza brachyantha TaxID=4533 RepID=UPI0007767E3E|nr:uncharacterized protein LOC107303807 [Oryza brachyantha]
MSPVNKVLSEEEAQGFDRTIDTLIGSPSLNNTNDKGNDGTKDLDKSKLLKDPAIPNGENEQMVSIIRDSSIKNKDLDDKNLGSLQDHSLTQDDDQSSHLPSIRDELLNKESETDTTAPFSTTIEDMISNMDSSAFVKKIKLLDETTERCEETNIGNSQSLLKENMEGPLEDEASGMGHDLIGEDTADKLDQGHTGVSTVDNPLMPKQGGSTSSTETITTDYLDADDSDIKEVVIEDEPIGRCNSSYVKPADDTTNLTSKYDRACIPEEKEDISEISQRETVETGIGSHEVINDEKIHELKNQGEDTCGTLNIGEIVSMFQSDTIATDVIEPEKHQLDKRGDDVPEEISDSLTGTEEHNVIERTHTEQEQGAKAAVVKDLADNSNEEESDGTQDVVSLVDVNGKDFTGLDSSLSYHLAIVNEEKGQTEVTEGLFRPSYPLQLIDGFHKRHLKLDSPYNNEETIISTYEVKTTAIHDALATSQFEKPQLILLEEPEAVRFENSGILSSCMQLVENSSKTNVFFPHGSKQEKEYTSTTDVGFTSEPNLEKIMVKVDLPAESNQKKIIANTDKDSREGYMLQTPAQKKDASEESSFSFSNEQHSKVVECISMTSISLMQVKDDADEEHEKSLLLSPREQEGVDFIVPNHSGRNKKPLQSLMTGESAGMRSPLKEQEPVPNNSTMVSSPRSKGKQKPRSSLFASCMCCATATN